MTDRKIKKIRIHPAIGIARLGNSPDHCFIGPEIPDDHPEARLYRDENHRLKRQGARFRLFAYDADDEVIGEISCEDSRVRSIRWTVHLRNTKAAGRRFEGILNQDVRFRNERFKREDLILDPGKHTIIGTLEGHTKSGRTKSSETNRLNRKLEKGRKVDLTCHTFMNQKFRKPLILGTLLTDGSGRLVVLGGHGESHSPTKSPIDESGDDFSFANHDDWYDDTSDGYVRANIIWKSGVRDAPADPLPSWVIVAPPKYAPSLQCVITLYDVLFEKAMRDKRCPGWKKKSHWIRSVLRQPDTPSFTTDIYPILKRADDMKWVYARAAVGHETEIDLSEPMQLVMRQHIVRQFREPSSDPTQPGSGTGKMPYIWSDLFDMGDLASETHPVNATLTRHQFEMMKKWASGDCDDRRSSAVPKGRVSPEGLDRAALDACVGAAFFPGIETSFHIRDKFAYVEPFRLDARKIKPGDATQQMAVPWQSDFIDCNDGDKPFAWWPTQRPIDVLVLKPGTKPRAVRWARSFGPDPNDMDAKELLRNWWRLGLLKETRNNVMEAYRAELRPKSRRLSNRKHR